MFIDRWKNFLSFLNIRFDLFAVSVRLVKQHRAQIDQCRIADSTLKVWNIQQRSLLFDLPDHANDIHAVDYSPDR